MGKPSIFSRNYEEQMKRRRINIILIILIVFLGIFFYIQYKIDKKGIGLIGLKKSKEKIENKIENNKKQSGEETNKNNNNQQKEIPKVEEKEYIYTSKTQKNFKLKYKIDGENKKFINVTCEGQIVDYDISQDGLKIVFDDKENQDIILFNIDGTSEDITMKTYTTKTSGFRFDKDKILNEKKDYIWSVKPHFTSDGKVVFLSRVPYYGTPRGLFLWYANYNGANNMQLGELAFELDKISYEGFDENGALIINSEGRVYKLEKGSFRIK